MFPRARISSSDALSHGIPSLYFQRDSQSSENKFNNILLQCGLPEHVQPIYDASKLPSHYLLKPPQYLLDQLAEHVRVHKVFGDGCVFASRAVPPVQQEAPILATFDSGADNHIFTLRDAQSLFSSLRISGLRIIGVNGTATSADLAGHLVIQVEAPDGRPRPARGQFFLGVHKPVR